MERKRQITQDIRKVNADFAFLPDGTVAELDRQDKVVYKDEPSRVEGRMRRVKRTQPYLAHLAVRNDLGDLFTHGLTPRYDHEISDNGWRMEHIPDDVFAMCDAWVAAVEAPTLDDLMEAANDFVSRDNRDVWHDTAQCRHCPGDPKYACYTSGYARELYQYPMVEVATEGGANYQVPFDAALFAVTVPGGVDYQTDYTIYQHNGTLGAVRSVGVSKDYLTREYVSRITNGEIVPACDVLPFTKTGFSPMSMRIVLDAWREEDGVYLPEKKTLDADQIFERLQGDIMMANVEKADGVDYNARLGAIQKKLAECGLGLMFGSANCGMGDVEFYGASYNVEHHLPGRYRQVGVDYGDVINEMYDRLVVERVKSDTTGDTNVE